jgi:hypothetical protein
MDSENQKTVSFRFKVCLSNGMEIPFHMKEEILEWYANFGGSNAESSEMLESMFKFVDSDIIECTYVIHKDVFDGYLTNGAIKTEHAMIADPDRSGNYPVVINDEEVKIYGELTDVLFSVKTKISL